MRYQRTKIATGGPANIPIDEELLSIVRAQQAVAITIMEGYGVSSPPKYLFLSSRTNRRGDRPYPMPTFHARLAALTELLEIRDSVGRLVRISKTHQYRHTKATSLLNAGVPLHVVMRYFGHVTPEMTMHYAKTLSQTAEREFLQYKKITADARELTMDPSQLYELLHLEQRADRVLPNGWCMLPPKQVCDRGNACLSCSKFATDESHRVELERQHQDTTQLIHRRQDAFQDRYGAPMPEDNVWLVTRQAEQQALVQVLIKLDEVKIRAGTSTAVRGAGSLGAAGGPA